MTLTDARGLVMSDNLTLEIPPEWDEVDAMRHRVVSFLVEAAEDPEVIDAITMVVCELSENAIKYGDFSGGGRVSVELALAEQRITVEVRNPAQARDLQQLHRLDRNIQWIRGYHDPFEAYVTRLKEISLQSPDCSESGLGLVRIAYEGEASLDFFLSERATVSIAAVYQR